MPMEMFVKNRLVKEAKKVTKKLLFIGKNRERITKSLQFNTTTYSLFLVLYVRFENLIDNPESRSNMGRT